MGNVRFPLARHATLFVAIPFLAVACGGAAQPTQTYRVPVPSSAPGTLAAPAASPSAPVAAGQTVQVTIANFAFDPATVTIRAGTTVVWTNKDGAPHTVTAADGSFASNGTLSTGATFESTFTTPGTFAYVCKVHSSMKATVVVTAAVGRTY